MSPTTIIAIATAVASIADAAVTICKNEVKK